MSLFGRYLQKPKGLKTGRAAGLYDAEAKASRAKCCKALSVSWGPSCCVGPHALPVTPNFSNLLPGTEKEERREPTNTFHCSWSLRPPAATQGFQREGERIR